MLLNFCHPCLRPEVSCSTVSTEGYEVKNLVSESSTGFLAYACIKPPINIDLTFLCNVEISRVIIWPVVGSQKSSGFQLLAKSTTDAGAPYVTLSTAYLNSDEPGVVFYRRDLNETLTSVPSNFLQRYIKISDLGAVNRACNLRLRIVKTENSVPAIGKIEVWGRVSRCCGRDVIAGANALWMQEHNPHISIVHDTIEPSSPRSTENEIDDTLEKSKYFLEIPEDFVDPITCEIMVQPIILPSGKIIDQFTLERHEGNEATWGRSPSDPFTGIPFSKTSRPVTATALKVRIDKFLIENSNADEIKNLPRTLGRKRAHVLEQSTIINNAEIILGNNKSRSDLTILKVSNRPLKRKSSLNLTKGQHKLPVLVARGKESMESMECKRSKFNEIVKLSIAGNHIEIEDNYPRNVGSEIDGDLELNVKSVLSSLKRFGTTETCKVTEISKGCVCCETGILYKLPCMHIVCRKVLTSVKILQCQDCSAPYTRSDPKRIHE